MDCSWPETEPTPFCFDRRKAADELLRGREFAQQLRLLLRRSSSSGEAASQDLLSRILTSFSQTLSILNRCSDSDDINGSIVDSPDAARKPEESGDSCKSGNDRRGCYKRRKSSHSWARESCNLVDDGHAWRKYGQKKILHAKHPRNYYRCTHKFDQGCQATKQVQRLEDHPPKFRTTYYAHHTCTNFLNASEIVLGSSNFNDDSCGVLLRFDATTTTAAAAAAPDRINKEQQHDDDATHFYLPSNHADAMAVKKEQQLIIGAAGIIDDNNNVCSPSDYMSTMGSIDFEDDVLQQFHF